MPEPGAMKILVEVLHPAHAHVFRHAIRVWLARGDQVLIASRGKDGANALLEAYGLPHVSLSDPGVGAAALSLALEFFPRVWRLWRLARRFQPDVLVGVMGAGIAPVGKILGRPALVFYDTEHAGLTNRFVYPLAYRVFTPDCYQGKVRGHHVTYPSYHELAYLHPKRFTPDPAVARGLGLDPDATYFIVRFVAWRASHDLGETGLDDAAKLALVRRLLPHGRVLVSSEGPLPAALDAHRFHGPPESLHHVMAFATLLVGESATMASESAVLGVHALYIRETGRGYTDELESRYHLVHNLRPSRPEELMARLDRLLASADLRAEGQRKRGKLLAEKTDATAWMLQAVDLARTERG